MLVIFILIYGAGLLTAWPFVAHKMAWSWAFHTSDTDLYNTIKVDGKKIFVPTSTTYVLSFLGAFCVVLLWPVTLSAAILHQRELSAQKKLKKMEAFIEKEGLNP